MEDEIHLNPRPKNYQKIQEFATNKPLNPAAKQEESSSKILVYILLAVVVLSIVFLIFGLVVLRIKAPTLRLSNVVVKDLRYNPSSLNMTVVAVISLHNMNFGRFKFHEGGATFSYGNATIGTANIYGGRVGGRERMQINATVDVSGGASENNYMNISRDIESNLVRVRSVAELRGKIRVMKIVIRRRTASMNCTMDLNLSGQEIQGLSCQ